MSNRGKGGRPGRYLAVVKTHDGRVLCLGPIFSDPGRKKFDCERLCRQHPGDEVEVRVWAKAPAALRRQALEDTASFRFNQ